MFPSKNSIQVTLEETGTRGGAVQCRPPAQVKILRRPKPVTSTEVSANGGQQKIDSTTTGSNNATQGLSSSSSSVVNENGDKRYSSVANHGNQNNNSSPTTIAAKPNETAYDRLHQDPFDDDWPAFDGSSGKNSRAINVKHIQQQPSNRQNFASVVNGSATTKAPYSQPTQQTNNSHQNDKLNSSNETTLVQGKDITESKKSIKTYQERADEYAKARLRILGSAFPENDDSSGDNVNVNRILNLDTTSGSSAASVDQHQRAQQVNGGSDNNDSDNNTSDYRNNRLGNTNRQCR